MGFFKQLSAVALLIVGALYLVSFALPDSWEVRREIEIATDSRNCHEVAGDLETWTEWCMWGSAIDPKASMNVGASAEDAGATVSWNGPETGAGTITITAADRDKGVWFDVALSGGGETFKGVLQYEEGGLGTTLSMTLRGDVRSNPIRRYVGRFREYNLGPSMVKSLVTLKRVIELGPHR